MYDKCYFCLDQLPKLKKESTASFFVNFGGAGVQKSRPTLLYTVSQDFSWMQLANVFGLFWGLSFVSAFGELVLAHVFAEWWVIL